MECKIFLLCLGCLNWLRDSHHIIVKRALADANAAVHCALCVQILQLDGNWIQLHCKLRMASLSLPLFSNYPILIIRLLSPMHCSAAYLCVNTQYSSNAGGLFALVDYSHVNFAHFMHQHFTGSFWPFQSAMHIKWCCVLKCRAICSSNSKLQW